MLRIAALFLLSLVVADSADACTRCGLFGRRCRFAHQVIAPVVVATPVIVEEVPVVQQPSTLVIQNNYNAPNGAAAALIAQPGNTVYGLQQAAQPYSLDPQDVLRQAAALTKGAQELAQQGLQGYQQTASLALTLNAAQPALAAAIQAPQQFTAPQQSSQSITLKQGTDGRWQLDVGQPGVIGDTVWKPGLKPDAEHLRKSPIRTESSQSLVAKHCSSCHGLDNPTPKARLNFDAGHELDCNTTLKAIASIERDPGVKPMPPGEKLPPEVIRELTREIRALARAGE